MKNILMLFFFIFCVQGYAQIKDSTTKKDTCINHKCESFGCCSGSGATFEEGITVFRKKLQGYVDVPKHLKGERRVMVIKFIVDEKGMIGNFEVTKSISKEYDKIGLNALEKMKEYLWTPAFIFLTPCETKLIKDRRQIPIIIE